MKKLTSMLLAVLIGCSFSLSAFAEEPSKNDVQSSIDNSFQNALNNVEFDLTQNQNQEKNIIMPNGETAIIGIRPCSPSTRGSYDYYDGAWEIYYISGVLNMEYWIDIKDGKITDAYNEWYTVVGLSAKSDTLTFNEKRATYKLTCSTVIVDLGSAVANLKAEISGTKLKTSIN